MVRKLFTVAATLVAGLLAACDQAPQSTVVYMRPGGVWPWLVGATRGDGPLLVETLTDPYDGASPSTAQVVADAVARGIQGRVTRTTANPAQAENDAFRVRVVLEAPRALDPRDVCAGRPIVKAETDDRLSVLAVFCNREEVAAAVIGSVPRPAGAADPALGDLIAQMARQMFSQQGDR